ncbi:hypothetical protein RvY_04283 [Ramazzottius varieornatus]|uniref:Uncharacterized protein n=1 Tax=Ramazzottius varieornatus TaxID=947166 RepID=A0A1D1V152_RAMVA|nr:hypothetical protein RvY_04283 [Ramazzottius varieornatus]
MSEELARVLCESAHCGSMESSSGHQSKHCEHVSVRAIKRSHTKPCTSPNTGSKGAGTLRCTWRIKHAA